MPAIPPSTKPSLSRRDLLMAGASAFTLAACGGSDSGSSTSSTSSQQATRSWAMGFGFNPPRYTTQDVLHTIDLFASRADCCIVHEETPWARLLAGETPASILTQEKVQLVQYIRNKGLTLLFMGDLNNGLDRASEAPQLVTAGRSLTEPAIQQLYRDYLLAVNSMLQPDVLGLAAETNLIRVAASSTLYAAVKQTANDTAAAIRASATHNQVPLMISVQVDTAWGRLDGSQIYSGIETDFADFAFVEQLGLSSYPYFGWTQPEDLPVDYYSRLLNQRSTPVMVTEGGWASASAGLLVSSPDMQARYIDRQAQLLDHVNAKGWLQLNFTDIDLANFPPPVPPILTVFSSLGLMDKDYQPKPALAHWDALFARPLLT